MILDTGVVITDYKDHQDYCYNEADCGCLTLNAYQRISSITSNWDPITGIMFDMPKGVYPSLGLNGEAGEVADKVKKLYRDKPDYDLAIKDIAKELGDTLWYLSEVARHFGFTLQEIAQMNIKKLADRRARNVIHGAGDNR